MNNPLGVSPSKGNQGTTRGKEKIFRPRWESNPRPRVSNGRSDPELPICDPGACRQEHEKINKIMAQAGAPKLKLSRFICRRATSLSALTVTCSPS